VSDLVWLIAIFCCTTVVIFLIDRLFPHGGRSKDDE
jgi:hypothetical protein